MLLWLAMRLATILGVHLMSPREIRNSVPVLQDLTGVGQVALLLAYYHKAREEDGSLQSASLDPIYLEMQLGAEGEILHPERPCHFLGPLLNTVSEEFWQAVFDYRGSEHYPSVIYCVREALQTQPKISSMIQDVVLYPDIPAEIRDSLPEESFFHLSSEALMKIPGDLLADAISVKALESILPSFPYASLAGCAPERREFIWSVLDAVWKEASATELESASVQMISVPEFWRSSPPPSFINRFTPRQWIHEKIPTAVLSLMPEAWWKDCPLEMLSEFDYRGLTKLSGVKWVVQEYVMSGKESCSRLGLLLGSLDLEDLLKVSEKCWNSLEMDQIKHVEHRLEELKDPLVQRLLENRRWASGLTKLNKRLLKLILKVQPKDGGGPCAYLDGAAFDQDGLPQLSLACAQALSVDCLSSMPARAVQSVLPDAFLESISLESKACEAAISNLFTSMKPRQRRIFGKKTAKDDPHPCIYASQVTLTSAVMERHSLTARCFAALPASVLQTLPADGFHSLPTDALAYMGAAKLRAIPVEAWASVRSSQLGRLRPSACKAFDAEMVDHIDTRFKSLPVQCVGKMAPSMWSHLVQKNISLPPGYMRYLTEEHLSDLSWLTSVDSRGSLTAAHWATLGLDAEPNPCSAIREDEVSDLEHPVIRAFWSNIPSGCLNALDWTPSDEQARLLPERSIAGARADLRQEIAKGTLTIKQEDCATWDGKFMAQLSVTELRAMAPEYIAKLPADAWEAADARVYKYWSANALSQLTKEAAKNVNLKHVTVAQWTQIKGEACGGFTEQQAVDLRAVDLLPPSCIFHLSGPFFGRLTIDQLNTVPILAWEGEINRHHMAAIKPALMQDFHAQFEILGTKWPASRPTHLHPCAGVTSKQRAAMSPDTLGQYERRCLLIRERLDQAGLLKGACGSVANQLISVSILLAWWFL